jgi:hypothetical protein
MKAYVDAVVGPRIAARNAHIDRALMDVDRSNADEHCVRPLMLLL